MTLADLGTALTLRSAGPACSSLVLGDPRPLAPYVDRRFGSFDLGDRDCGAAHGEQRYFHEDGGEAQHARPVADVLAVEGCAHEARERVPDKHRGAEESGGDPGAHVVGD